MPSFTRSTAVYLCAAALNAAVPFMVLPLLARWLSPGEFGIVGSYLALVNIAVVLAGLSVHGIISVVHFREGPGKVPAYIRAALRLLALTGGPLLLILVIAGPWVEDATAVPSAWLWTVGLVAICQFIVTLGLAVFQTREEAWTYGALQVGLAVGWGSTSLLFIAVAGLGWEGRALGQVAAAALAALAALLLLGRRGGLAPVAAAPLPDLLKFGVPLLPHSLSAAIMAGADRLMLNGMGGPDVAGQYFAAFQMAAVLTVAASAVNQAWVPWLYRRLANPTVANARSVVQVTYGMFGGLLLAALILAVLAGWLVPLVAGPRYAQAVPLLHWLAPAAALSGMYYFVTNYLFYGQRTGLLSVITVSCSLLQLALMAVAIPRWGAEGAAMAVFAAALVYWLATWQAAHRVVPMPWFGVARSTA